MLASSALVSLLLAATPTGDLRLGVGILSQPLQGELGLAARSFVLSRRGELGLPATSNLGPAELFGTRFGVSIHLAQQVDGVEIYGAKVVVTLDRNRRVVQLASSLAPYRQAVTDWRMSPSQALRLAANEIPGALLQSSKEPYGGVRRAFFQVGDEVRSGYLTFVPTLDLTQNWFVAIDATRSEVLWSQNRVFHAAEEAQVYASSPGGLDAGVGRTALQVEPLRHADGGSMVLANDGGLLLGHQLTVYGCCPNQACSTEADAGPKHATGVATYSGRTFNYDVAVCDRVQRSHFQDGGSEATYLYEPHDPPARAGATPGPVRQAELADSDLFSEVHAFYHLNQVYDFVRALSTAASPLFPGQNVQPFQMRDEKLGKKPAVWSNLTFPNYNEMMVGLFLTGTASTNNLTRMDNAAFMAKENFSQLILPEYMLDVDTLMIFQGNGADFGYDAPVLWHEFGHGVIYSTAAFDSFTVDSRSANNEGGALHEGFADYLAGAFGQSSKIGEYVGPRAGGASAAPIGGEVPLRDMENALACPDVLWGEVHQDSQHFSGALWQARKQHFQGADQGRTFDAAIYAALVSMTPATDFAQAAAQVAAHLPAAFPGVQAEEKMKAIFDGRGVTNCSKVVDLTGTSAPRPYYGIGGRQAAGVGAGMVVPGPYQMKLKAPQGARSVTVTAKVQSSPLGPSSSGAVILAKVGQPVSFVKSGTSLTNDAAAKANGTLSGTNLTAKVTLDVPCGEEVFFTLGSSSTGGEALQDVVATLEPAASCETDGGVDGGGAADAGPGTTLLFESVQEGGKAGAGRVPEGCGCGSAGAALSAFSLLGLLALGRARRAGRGRPTAPTAGR